MTLRRRVRIVLRVSLGSSDLRFVRLVLGRRAEKIKITSLMRLQNMFQIHRVVTSMKTLRSRTPPRRSFFHLLLGYKQL